MLILAGHSNILKHTGDMSNSSSVRLAFESCTGRRISCRWQSPGPSCFPSARTYRRPNPYSLQTAPDFYGMSSTTPFEEMKIGKLMPFCRPAHGMSNNPHLYSREYCG